MVLHTDDWTGTQTPAGGQRAAGAHARTHPHTRRACYPADGEGVAVKLLGEHESLSEHGFVVVGVLHDGGGGGVAKHRPHVTLERLHDRRLQLLVPVEGTRHKRRT